MPYPQRYNPNNNFSRDEELGDLERGEKLDGEFRRLSEVTNQLNTFLKQIATADARLRLDQAVKQNDIITVQTETVAASTNVVFDQPIDAATDLVRAFLDGTRIDPAGYDDLSVTFAPAITGELELRIYYNMAGVLNRIQAITDGEGASYIGYDDEEDRYTADNVRDALTEAKRTVDDFITAVGDLGRYLLRDGSRTLLGQWQVNEFSEVIITPVAAGGTATITTLPVDGETFTISDGLVTQIYEFDDDASVSPGNSQVTIGADKITTGQNLVAAINGSPIAISASWAANGTNADITLAAQVPGSMANVALAATGAWYSSLTGMTGGVDGSFGPALSSQFRIRGMPRSLQDGDAVVHEQLRDVLTEISQFVSAFLRTDGANQMSASLRMSGNKVVNLGAGTNDDDAVTVLQLANAIDAALSSVGGDLTDYLNRVSTTDGMGRDLPMGGYKITDCLEVAGLAAPDAADKAANKGYVDDKLVEAFSTAATDTSFVLKPDGVGGTLFGAAPAQAIPAQSVIYEKDLAANSVSIVIATDKKYVVHGLGIVSDGGTIQYSHVGHAYVVNGVIVFQMSIRASADSLGGTFSIVGSTLTYSQGAGDTTESTSIIAHEVF